MKNLAFKLAPLFFLVSMQSQTGTKKYSAVLNQSSTDAPVATAVKSDLQGTLTYGYTSTGFYTLTNTLPEFTAAKTRVKINGIRGLVEITSISTTVLTFKTYGDDGTIANAKLLNSVIEIEIDN
jgi:hypothetical protein